MRVIEKIEVSKLKYGCVVVTQNFLFNYSLFKIILNPSKKVEFSSENQKDMSVDGRCRIAYFVKPEITKRIYFIRTEHPSKSKCANIMLSFT